MSDFDVKSAWLGKLRNDHPALAERMINAAAERSTEVSLEDQIFNILEEHLEPMPTSKEEHNRIKAKKIAEFMEGE